MVKNNIISASKANRLFWLGRYEERVYLTLHMLRKCYDKMIDGDSSDYETFWQKLDICNSYNTKEEFKSGMLFDEENQSSVISAQLRAQDNAILLREDIMSETLSYIEMSIALMKRLKKQEDGTILSLQPVTDWALAFWGSVQQRVFNSKARMLMYVGREIENMDFLLRFDYPVERIAMSLNLISKHLEDYPEFYDRDTMLMMEALLEVERSAKASLDSRSKMLYLLSNLMTV